MTPTIRKAKAVVRSTTRQRWSRSHLRRYVFQSLGGVIFSHDAIRLLIGTGSVTEYTIANVHKATDAVIKAGKLPDWCHLNEASAEVSMNTRMYQYGMNLPCTRARALATGR
jgi:hypothetical protein